MIPGQGEIPAKGNGIGVLLCRSGGTADSSGFIFMQQDLAGSCRVLLLF